MTRSGKRYISAQNVILRYAYKKLHPGPSGQNWYEIQLESITFSRWSEAYPPFLALAASQQRRRVSFRVVVRGGRVPSNEQSTITNIT